MKKLLALLLAGIMVFALVGCGTDFEGEWEVVDIEVDDSEMKDMPEDQKEMALNMAKSMLEGMKIVLEEGGEGVVEAVGQKGDITWEADGDTVTIEGEDGDAMEGTMDGDQLILEMDGTKLVFEKAE